ncbi:hypothetical protein M3Y97_00037900 [Aphelenchoides bicaudatus]|nr:hypothetical protein M3Y97_00037900 [Aphelenchoides bicaudatus]
MLGKFATFLVALLVTLVSISSAASTADRVLGTRLMLKKASKPVVEWDDLGFAWGKRSDPELMEPEQLSLQRFVRSLKPAKKNDRVNWDDLGFAWG